MKKKEMIEALKAAGVEFDKSKTKDQLLEEFHEILAPSNVTVDEGESEAPAIPAPLTEVPDELKSEVCTEELFLKGAADPTEDACRDCPALDACMQQKAAITGVKSAPKTTRKRAAKSSESKLFIQSMIEAGKYTRQQIIEAYLAEYPSHAKSTVGTYLSDSKNPKYNAFPWPAKVDKKSKVFSFVKEEVVDEKAA